MTSEAMTFEELCDAVRAYVEALPTEGGRGHRDHWRDRLDNALADLRAALSDTDRLALQDGEQ